MEAEMPERRKEQRKNLMSYSQVFELYEGRLLGYLADLTPKGAMVIGDQPVPLDSTFTLQIELPELPEVKASRMSLPARVVWCQSDLSPDYHDIGFEFTEVRPEQLQIIKAMMENYEFRREPPNY